VKTCPHCDTGYPDKHTTCPTHGVLLNEIRDLKPGMVIHHSYRIVRKLGKGGMGSVYLAQHTLMDEPRALKFLSSELSSDQDFTSRFLREVRTLRQVRNRNVVDCGDLERAEDDSLFFSMEFVDGPDLRRFLTEGQPAEGLPVPLALSIARGIAEGLAAAHARGMVHRDIKPENILMARDGDTWLPKIADFGIVATKESSSVYTRTGGTLLTIAYAAPEQWRGTPAAELDGRTDLYALGGLLYEMLTGQTPFQAESYEGWSHQHQTTPPQPPSILRPELANWQGLDALVLRLLAKDREDRPNDVAEVLNLLDVVRYVPPEAHLETEINEAVSSRNSDLSTKTSKQAHRRGIWLGLLASGLILAALAVWFISQRPKQTANSALEAPAGIESQPVKTQSEKRLNVQPAIPKPTNQKPVGTSEPKPAQVEVPKPSTPQPGAPPEQKPSQVENSKPSAQQPSIAEVEKQANALSSGGRYSEAAPLLDQACTGGSSEACRNLGSMYIQGTGVEKDASRGITLLTKACNAGNATSCGNLGVFYETGTGVTKDESRSAVLFSKSCDGGNAAGCYLLGHKYENGLGVARDVTRAAALFTKSCDAGFIDACSSLGGMYAQGIGVAHDNSRAAALFTKACEAGNSPGCGMLGISYLNGWGVDKDVEKARQLFSKSCTIGNQISCDQLKKIQ